MSNVQCLAVPREHLDIIWPAVEPMFAKAVGTAADKFSAAGILEGAHAGTYVVWVVTVDDTITAAVTSRIIEYPLRRAMALDWIGGSRMKVWFAHAMRVMKEHATRNDCSHMEGYGREAWMRWIGKEGWRPEYVAFRMELGNG
jgi:hypothetical protein